NSELFVRAAVISALLPFRSISESVRAELHPIPAPQIPELSTAPAHPQHQPALHSDSAVVRECKQQCTSDHAAESAKHNPAWRQSRSSSRRRSNLEALCAAGPDGSSVGACIRGTAPFRFHRPDENDKERSKCCSVRGLGPAFPR